jgi:hypothetical protein
MKIIAIKDRIGTARLSTEQSALVAGVLGLFQVSATGRMRWDVYMATFVQLATHPCAGWVSLATEDVGSLFTAL